MVRLINADAIPYVTDETYLHEFDYAYRYAIDAMPTVDAVPVVHSSWEILNEHEEYVYGFKRVHDLVGVETWAVVARCNKCGFGHYFIGGHMCYYYCPNCGARMDDNG